MLKRVFLILDLGHGSEATALNYTANFSFISEKISMYVWCILLKNNHNLNWEVG